MRFLFWASALLFLTSSLARVHQSHHRPRRAHSLFLLHPSTTWRLCRDFTDRSRIQRLLQPILVERQVETPSHRAVGQFLKNTLENLGWHTTWDDFFAVTPHGPKRFRSLIATSDMRSPRRLTLACHYDSKIFVGQRFVGATDSAVPCAMMLDIATALTPYFYRRAAQDIALQLVFFDGEEAFENWSPTDSIYGARHLAHKWSQSPSAYPTAGSSSKAFPNELDRMVS